MRKYPDVALEMPMTRHEIMLRAYAKESSWIEGGEDTVHQRAAIKKGKKEV